MRLRFSIAAVVALGVAVDLPARAQEVTPTTTAPQASPAALPEEPPKEPPKGKPMIVAGGVVTGLGAVSTIFGTVRLLQAAGSTEGESADSFRVVGVAYLAAGLVVLAVGVPMVWFGVQRRRAWQAWQAERRVALLPRIDRSVRGTWTAGFELGF